MGLQIKKYVNGDGVFYIWQQIILELSKLSKQLMTWVTDRFIQSVNGKSGSSITIEKGDVGLGNVDNTADADKHVAHAATAGDADTLDGKQAADFLLKSEHEDYASVIASSLNDLDTRKVDKVAGKDLSTNDYTDEEKKKLEGIEAGAQKNTVTSVAGKTGDVVINKDDVGGLQDVLDSKQDNLPFTSAPSESNKVVTQNELNAVATGTSIYLGTIDSVEQLSTTAIKGNFYRVKTAWDGVHVGDMIIAEKDNPAAIIDDVNWSLMHNEMNTDTTYTFEDGTDGFSVTPSTGDKQKVKVEVKKVNGRSVESDVPENAKFTDEHTTKDGHYAPSEDAGSQLSKSASGGTEAWDFNVVTGVTIKRDSKGHVVGMDVASKKVPANPNTDYQTTKEGHYNPTDEKTLYPDTSVLRDDTRDMALVGAVHEDEKGHVVSVDTCAILTFTDDEIAAIIDQVKAKIAAEMEQQ